LDSLKAKGLVVALTPEGRGHVVTHALYQPRELDTLRARYQGGGLAAAAGEEESGAVAPAYANAPPAMPAGGGSDGGVAALRQELADLRAQLAQLRGDLDEVGAAQHRMAEEVRALKDALGG
jgi:hypothetical protein